MTVVEKREKDGAVDTATEEPREAPRWWQILLFFTLWTLVMGGSAVYLYLEGLSLNNQLEHYDCSSPKIVGLFPCPVGEAERARAIAMALLWLAPFVLYPALRLSNRVRANASEKT